MKRIIPALLLLAAALLLMLAALGPAQEKASRPERAQAKAPGAFHSAERKGIPNVPPDTACKDCHKAAPHEANRGVRAFLNQHAAYLSCLVCHANGPGVRLARGGEQVRISVTLDGKTPEPPKVIGKDHALAGARFVPRPGECRTCHSRNSKFLTENRFFDDYRMRLLEDLDVLPAMENAQ